MALQLIAEGLEPAAVPGNDAVLRTLLLGGRELVPVSDAGSGAVGVDDERAELFAEVEAAGRLRVAMLRRGQ